MNAYPFIECQSMISALLMFLFMRVFSNEDV